MTALDSANPSLLSQRIDRLSAGSAKIGCLFNPNGGQGRKRLPEIRQVLDQIPGIISREGTDAATFKTALEFLLQAEIDLLVIVAGDGTTHAILAHLFRIFPATEDWPILMIVPGGTTNMTPFDLGITGKPDQVLRRLQTYLARPSSIQLQKRSAFCIEQAGIEKMYGMFFAVGLVARGVKFSRSPVKQVGITGNSYTFLIMLHSVITALIGIFTGRHHADWKPVTMTLTETDGKIHQGTFLFALISASHRILLNMRPYWGKEALPLHVTWIKQQPKRLWRSLWPLLTGQGDKLKESDGYFSHNMQELSLSLDDEYVIDGELYRSNHANEPLRISATAPITFLVV
ncbi:MAG: diacylglycerol kinase family protein [Nitrosomonas sp.]